MFDKIISPKIADKLWKISHLQDLITWEYLNKETNEAFQEIVKKFFPWETERAKILNPWSYIWSIVYFWKKSFFWAPKSNYSIDWIEFMICLLTTAEARLKINVDILELESINSANYYFDWKTEYFLHLFDKEYDDWYTQKFVLLETFHNKIFLRKLFKVSDFDSIAYWEEVSLWYLEETKDLPSALTIDLERLVLTKKAWLEEVKILETIINSIDRKLAHNDHTIMDYGDVWTIIKWMDIDHARVDPDDENSAIDMSLLWKILVTDGENSEGVQPGVEIVKNTYESIKSSLDIIDSQLMQVSSITWIPAFAFTNNVKAWNDSWNAKEKASTIFYKKIEWYHNITKDLFNKFWDRINLKEEERILEFQEIITTSAKDLLDIEDQKIQNEKAKVDSWFSTKKMAIMNIHNVDEKEADFILKQVQNDNTTQNPTPDKEEDKD